MRTTARDLGRSGVAGVPVKRGPGVSARDELLGFEGRDIDGGTLSERGGKFCGALTGGSEVPVVKQGANVGGRRGAGKRASKSVENVKQTRRRIALIPPKRFFD